MSDDVDYDPADEIDALEEADETDGPGPSFTVTRPAGATDVTVIDLEDAGIDWPGLVQAAVAAKGTADFDRYRWPRALDGNAARLLFVWARSPLEAPRRGDDAVADSLGLPWYPKHGSRPDDQLRLIWRTLQSIDTCEAEDDWITAVIDACGELGSGDDPDDDELAESAFMWWPSDVVLAHEPAHHRTGLTLLDAVGRELAHDICQDHRPAPSIPRNAHGEPLATLEAVTGADDPVAAAIAICAENYRRRRTPGRAPAGRPPATSTIIGHMTPRERLRVAAAAVEQFGVKQAAVARSLDVRADSLNRSLRRRRQQRS